MAHPYLSCLTPTRIWNQIRCWVSYFLSLLKINKVQHYPTFVSVEPVNFCQLHCPQCPVGMQNTHNPIILDIPLYAKILDEISPYTHTLILYFQGEPLLNKQLPELIRLAKKKRLYTIISTNAQALTQDYAAQLIATGIDRIIVSIDGFTQASYEQYRVGGSLQKALDGLKYLQHEKTKQYAHTQIILQCLHLKSNEQEWGDVKQHYKEWGADKLVFKTAQFYDYQHGNALMPTKEKYSRYKKVSNHYERKKPYRNHCLRLWSGCVITAEGKVLPCCFDKSHQYVLGDLRTQSFHEIWHSPTAHAFRQRLLHHRKEIDICQNCTE